MYSHSVILVTLMVTSLFLYQQGITATVSPMGGTRLELVQIVFRHGNRTPAAPYQGDPNAHETFHPYGWYQLNGAGRQRAYDLGRYLRSLYRDFVGDYDLDTVNITSSDFDRTKMSAQLVAAGLFPPSGARKWGIPGGLGDFWQPITFHYKPQEEDDLTLLYGIDCPAYEEARIEIENGIVAKSVLDMELVEALAKHANVPFLLRNLYTFHQTVEMEGFHNMTIPDWLKPFYPDRIRQLGLACLKLSTWTKNMQRLRGGSLLGHITRQMELKAQGSKLKMWLYSSHDVTLAALGTAMRVWDDFFPDFSSAVIVELHSNKAGKYFVKTLFHNDTSKLPMLLTVPGCYELCPLNEFRDILEDSIPQSLKEECQHTSMDNLSSDASAGHGAPICQTGLLLQVILIFTSPRLLL